MRAAQLRIAVRARAPDPSDDRGQLLIRTASAHHGTQVMSASSEQTGVQLAFRRYSRPGARMTEGAGNTGDNSDLASTIAVAPPD